MKAILLVLLLVAMVGVSGCVSQDTGDTGDSLQPTGGDPESEAYDQLEQELEAAVEDIDLDDIEGALLE